MPSIRILGGRHKQKSIQSPHHDGLRPTTHRVRQTAFDILLHRFYVERIGKTDPFSGLRILDICAGLGGYGFEALSRGAEQITFIEQSAHLAKQLSDVVRSWNGLDRVLVWNQAWPMLLPIGHAPYDVLFLDPPYAQEEAVMTAMIQACQSWMTDQSLLIVETDRTLSPVAGWPIVFVRTIGQKTLSFLKKGDMSVETTPDAC